MVIGMMKSRSFKLVSISDDYVSYTVFNGETIFKEKTKNIITKNLIDFFSDEEKDKIMFFSSSIQSNSVKERRTLAFTILFALYIISFMCAIPLSQNKIILFSTVQPMGIFIFPLTFVFIDSINEIFGRNLAKSSVYSVSLALIISAFFISTSYNLLDTGTTKGQAFSVVLENLPKLLLINSLCVLVADSINNYLYSYLKSFFHGSFLTIRSGISTIVGQFIYTVIWISLFYNKTLNINNMITYMFDNYLFKLIYGIAFCMPLTLILVFILKKYIFNISLANQK